MNTFFGRPPLSPLQWSHFFLRWRVWRYLTRVELPVIGSWLPNPRIGIITNMNCFRKVSLRYQKCEAVSLRIRLFLVLFIAQGAVHVWERASERCRPVTIKFFRLYLLNVLWIYCTPSLMPPLPYQIPIISHLDYVLLRLILSSFLSPYCCLMSCLKCQSGILAWC